MQTPRPIDALSRALACLQQKRAEVPPSPDLQAQAAAMQGQPPQAPMAPPPPPMPPGAPAPMPPPGAIDPATGQTIGPPPPGIDPATGQPIGMPPVGGPPPGAPVLDPATGQPTAPIQEDPMNMPMGNVPLGAVMQMLGDMIQQASGKKGDNQLKDTVAQQDQRISQLEQQLSTVMGMPPPPAAQQPPAPAPVQKAAAGPVDRFHIGTQSPAMQARIRRLLQNSGLKG